MSDVALAAAPSLLPPLPQRAAPVQECAHLDRDGHARRGPLAQNLGHARAQAVVLELRLFLLWQSEQRVSREKRKRARWGRVRCSDAVQKSEEKVKGEDTRERVCVYVCFSFTAQALFLAFSSCYLTPLDTVALLSHSWPASH